MPELKHHTCNGNKWTWTTTEESEHWQRDRDGKVAPVSNIEALKRFDKANPIRASIDDLERLKRMAAGDSTTGGGQARSALTNA